MNTYLLYTLSKCISFASPQNTHFKMEKLINRKSKTKALKIETTEPQHPIRVCESP